MAVRAPAIPTTLDWINTGGAPVVLSELRGQVVLLDFWTMGCINCLHVIPSLRELENRFGDALAVVGVHSGKFTAERDTMAIRDAVVRLGVHHPVANDRQFRLWREYAARGWPTIVLLDARGYLVFQEAGEFSLDALAARIQGLVDAARDEGILTPRPSRYVAESPVHTPGELRYPGKIAVDGRRVAIADTGHDRVVVGTSEDGGRRIRLTTTIGAGEPGFSQGRFDSARLRAPQGVAFAGDRLVIADAGNHAVRVADLATGQLATLTGTGRRAWTRTERQAGAIASPWDVVVDHDVAYVAMAGLHQLWAFPLDGSVPSVVAGSGAEELHDALPHAAALAQPMGLALHDGALWFADAESSAIRRAPLRNSDIATRDITNSELANRELVTTIVGTGLFDFGDRDGVGDEVRLQHPQALVVTADGTILIADSYNGVIRELDPATRRVRTVQSGLHMPSGLALADGGLFVADTNAHRIVGSDGEIEIVW